MKVAYLQFTKTVEDDILMALVRKNGEVVSIGKDDLILPTVVNISGYSMPRLSQVLVRAYRELFELHVKDGEPSQAARDRFQFRANRVAQLCRQNGTDIIVVYEKTSDTNLLRDTLKKAIKGTEK
jgi:hypothetical protein